MRKILKVGLLLGGILVVAVAVFVYPGDWVPKKEFTRREMVIARQAVETYTSEHNHLPATLEEALQSTGKPRVVDLWGDWFRYVVVDEDHALLLSVRRGTSGRPSDALVLECVRTPVPAQ